MMKIGYGNAPPYPDDIDEEADDFLMLCFASDPSERSSASDLLKHTFVKVHCTLVMLANGLLYCNDIHTLRFLWMTR